MQKDYSTGTTRNREGSSDGASPRRSTKQWGRSRLDQAWLNPDAIPHELASRTGTVSSEDLVGVEGTTARNIETIVSAGVHFYDTGSFELARAAFAEAVNVHVASCGDHCVIHPESPTPMAARLSFVDDIVQTAFDEIVTIQRRAVKIRRIAHGEFNRLVTLDAYEANQPMYVLHGSFASEPHSTEGLKRAQSPMPIEEDSAVKEARKRWKGRFRARVHAMETLLANAVDDNIPTPSSDGDD